MARSERQKLLARRLAVKGPLAPADDSFRQNYPKLFGLLTIALHAGDRVLEPIRLSVTVGDADWVMSLSDGVLAQSLTVRALTLDAGLQELDRVLGTEAAKWVPWKGKLPRVPQIKKRRARREVDEGDTDE